MKKGIFFINVFGCPDVSGDLEKMFLLMQNQDISGLQMDYAELQSIDGVRFKELLDKHGAELLCTHITPRLLSDDDAVFDTAVRECEEALETISRFGCKRLMVVPFNPADVSDRTASLKRFAEGLKIVVEKAKKYGVSVVIENISQRILPFSMPEDIEYLLDNVEDLEFCFDTGNFVCTKIDVIGAFERLKDRIDMVHVKDFGICDQGGFSCDSGINVDHVDFGKGGAKLFEVMKKIIAFRPCVPYVLEIHSVSPDKEAIEQACNFFAGIKG